MQPQFRMLSLLRLSFAWLSTTFVVVLLAMPLQAAPPISSIQPDGFGGGEYRMREHAPHLTDAQRREIRSSIESNIRALQSEGKLPALLGAHPQIDWPLRAASGFVDFGYHGTSNFVDHDPAYPGAVLDWACTDRSYDLANGYNHTGIDFFTWPFPWLRMQNSQVEVVAAAEGTIVLKSDGNFDRNCGFGAGNWNAVYVRHPDNSVAWYGHLKNGSLTSKGVGDSVSQGEYLGVVGSSGNSTGPHLHFELYDSSGALNDPFEGPCNSLNPDTWWLAQPPYYDSAINHLATGHAAPDAVPACPTVETPNESNVFQFGDPIYFSTYYRDQASFLTSENRIWRPDGGLHAQWADPSPPNLYAASYYYTYFSSFAPSGPAGTWRYEVTYNGRTYSHPFVLASGTPASRVPDRGGLAEPPLTLAKWTGDSITLTWGASCNPGNNYYEIYEGTLGAVPFHVSRVCNTGGLRTWTFSPAAGNRYYLVVPANGLREGSYGYRSGSIERPIGAFQCLPQEIAGCP